jgi:hypothetical protein
MAGCKILRGLMPKSGVMRWHDAILHARHTSNKSARCPGCSYRNPSFTAPDSVLLLLLSNFKLHHKNLIKKNGARCRFRTCDPYRVKVMLYH